jgi:hypothetical protein
MDIPRTRVHLIVSICTVLLSIVHATECVYTLSLLRTARITRAAETLFQPQVLSHGDRHPAIALVVRVEVRSVRCTMCFRCASQQPLQQVNYASRTVADRWPPTRASFAASELWSTPTRVRSAKRSQPVQFGWCRQRHCAQPSSTTWCAGIAAAWRHFGLNPRNGLGQMGHRACLYAVQHAAWPVCARVSMLSCTHSWAHGSIICVGAPSPRRP